MIEQLLEKSKVIYHYGSYVYGTFNENKSDYDYIVIIPTEIEFENGIQLKKDGNDYTFYKEDYFIKSIQDHKIDALECIFLDSRYIIGNNIYLKNFVYNEQKLRESISKICSNSFVKAKKKLIIEKDYDFYKSIKSLFHSIRIFDFGKQIAEYGRITNYSSCNKLWEEISKETSKDWEYYKLKYKPIYNHYHSEFVKVASKN